MKILIVFYSYSNNNRVLAQALKEQLNADIFELEEFGKRTGVTIMLDIIFSRMPLIRFSPTSFRSYDSILFVAPIWAGKIASPMRAFLKNEKSEIKRYAFISICGGAGGLQGENIKKNLEALVGHPPMAVCELSINDLLVPTQKGKMKYTSSFRINRDHLRQFEGKIAQLVHQMQIASDVLESNT